jgi:GNAT superfamily N-acetyltransferase
MPALSTADLPIRPVRKDERGELARFIRAGWGSTTITSRGVAHDAASLPCLIAVDGERWLGLAAYVPTDDECELVLLEAFERHSGIGTALLAATIEAARNLNSRRLWLVTTNDNLDALRFYQRRGLRLARLWVDATTEARERLKPEIPMLGEYGIPIHDELELELILSTASDQTEDPIERRREA